MTVLEDGTIKSTRNDVADNQCSPSWFNRSPIIHTPFAREIFSTDRVIGHLPYQNFTFPHKGIRAKLCAWSEGHNRVEARRGRKKENIAHS